MYLGVRVSPIVSLFLGFPECVSGGRVSLNVSLVLGLPLMCLGVRVPLMCLWC